MDDSFYEFGSTSNRNNYDINTEFFGGDDGGALGSGQKDMLNDVPEEDDRGIPFIISVANAETVGVDGNAIIDTKNIKIKINEGKARVLSTEQEFEEEEFTIQFTVENIIKVYAEVKLAQDGSGAYTIVTDPKIKYYESKEADPNGVNFAFVKEDDQTFARQLIGTIEIIKLDDSYDPNSSRDFHKAKITQIIAGNFAFGPETGEETDANGVNTKAGLREVLVCINDKLYKMEIDVVALEAADDVGGT